MSESGEAYYSTEEKAINLLSKSYPPESWYDSYIRSVDQRAGQSDITTPAGIFKAIWVDDAQSLLLKGETNPSNITFHRAFIKNIGLWNWLIPKRKNNGFVP